MLAIVVCGEIASGKSTVSKYVAQAMKCKLLSFGALIREECVRAGVDPTRAACQQVGYNMFQRLGDAGIVHALLQNAGELSAGGVVIDGVRHPRVLSELRVLFSPVFVIAVVAQLEDRFQRYRARDGGEFVSIEEFVAISGHSIETGIPALFREADIVVDAGVSEEEMLDAVRRALVSEQILPR